MLRVDWQEDPGSLEPGDGGFAATNVLMNIMDPLVRLGPNNEPLPGLARSWDFSPDGKTLTFHLRHDGRWTNGDPVTAHDFEWSWLRELSPKLAKFYAYEFYGLSGGLGIVGAQAYNECDPEKRDCAALRDKVAIKALDDYTLQLRLTRPQPWFPSLVSFAPFLALHRATVEKYGEAWAEPEHIVTDGPFKLTRWVPKKELDLARWDGWRDAKDVKLARVLGYMHGDGDERLREFDTGKVDAFPGGYIPFIRGKPGYRRYPLLDTEFYGFNVKNVPDVNERRALALAIDRSSLADHPRVPATGLTPMGMPGFSTANPTSPWLPPNGDIAAARRVMANAVNPKKNLTLVYNKPSPPDVGQTATAVARVWSQLGVHVTIRSLEWTKYLRALGPPPSANVDVFREGWFADYPDPYNFLQLAQCDSDKNSSGYCDPAYDALLNRAVAARDDKRRYALYAAAERSLFGPRGSMPLVPLYWEGVDSLVRSDVKGFDLTGEVNATYTDLSKVSIEKR